jgi:hypothetical protein
MEQLTIDDFLTHKKFKVGHRLNIIGSRMEVIVSNKRMIVLYCLRTEKVYPLRLKEEKG